MDELDERTRLADELINTVLAERPLAPLPAGFMEQVLVQIQMAQTQTTQTTSVAVRFKLELLDVALPLLCACLVITVLVLSGQLAFLGVPPPVDWAAAITSLELTTPEWLDWVGLLLFAEIGMGLLFCVWLWLDRPLLLKNGEA
jgi:hypothetical protein